MIAAEYEPALLDRRRSPRAPVSLDAAIGRGGLDRALCKVVDLSLHGARLLTYSRLAQGAIIWLTLPLLGKVAATIIWSDDFEARCRFRDPIGDDAFARLTTH